ncbi:MAG: exopolysaccharide biosynthesis polyprenyl glycosylphosphotransferase [Planctomycetota bacterium]|jgi:exopolysaccharide biosynthesis polyprenyl glycosylphosphotransferase|nr:exopolysaccharide biosynthesis polyprenyl glycosylphosphotransferase [Planctomycetota bacterium]
MLAARLKNMFLSLLLVEVISSIAAFIPCCYAIYYYPHIFSLGIATPLSFLITFFFFLLFVFMMFFYQKIVRFSRFTHSISWEGFFTAQATLMLMGIFFLGICLVFANMETFYLILAFMIATMGLITSGHVLTSFFLQSLYSQPANMLKIVVIGMNHRTSDFCKVLQATSILGTEVRGYLDKKEIPNSPANYLGGLENLDTILRSEVIDVVFIFLPIRSFYDDIHKAIATSVFYGVAAYIVGNVFETGSIKRQPLCISDFGNMAFSSTSVDFFGLVSKRFMDVILSFFLLVSLSPLLLAIAIFIRRVSPGPVIFRQERIGLNKRTFTLLKFRTMVPDAEARQQEIAHLNEMDGPAFKIANDPRLIPGGSFLRRYSLDELPQLWNVLRGDMSLVGPRPLSRRDYDLLKEDWQRKRFSIRPGITCIWQVGGRNDITFQQWMEMDLDYIDRWSLGLDVLLLLKTFVAVVAGSGK